METIDTLEKLPAGLYRPWYGKNAAGEKQYTKQVWIRWSCRRMCGNLQCSGTHRESTGTESVRDAKRIRANKLAAVNAGKVITRRVENTSFADLVEMITSEYQANGRKSLNRLKASIAHLGKVFSGYKATAITTDRITSYTSERLAVAKPATVRLELCAIKRMFNLAVRAERVGKAPYIPMVTVDNARQGFMTEPQYRAVLPHLTEDLRPAIEFMWLVGWRREETFGLTWEEIDFTSQTIVLGGARAKNKEQRIVPFHMYPALAALIYAQAKRKNGPFVFHRGGRRIVDCRIQWRRATKAAGVPGALLHDFRRSAARRMIAAGIPEQTAMKVLGHKTASIFRRYNIVTTADLANATAKLAALDSLPIAADARVSIAVNA